MRTVIFLGPSLPRPAARAILPEATYLPPARQADVVSAIETYQPDVLALIDGAFGQSLAVWHKEILFALDRGVRVYGAASLGALRAAELASFGMLGVGEIYRQFASGELQDDDEVALVHASAAEDFRVISEPMVNLRATFTLARTAGALSADECTLLIATAKHLYFAERTLPGILAAAATQGLAPATAERLSAVVADHYVDVKRRDAAHLLEVIRDLPDPLPATPHTFTLERTASFDTLYASDRRVRQDGIDVPLRAIAAHAALHHVPFDDLNFAALNRALVQLLADSLHVSPTPAEIEAEIQRFRVRRGLAGDAALAAWITDQHLSRESFEALMGEVATCRRLQRWLLARDRGARRTRWVLDELRLRGEYPAVATSAAQQHAVSETWDADGYLPQAEVDLGPLVADHMQATGWQLAAPLATWAAEAGFDSAQEMALELSLAARVRERFKAAARALAGATLSPESR
ncbi:MAG TPA: TfuA-like protein [Chloroflexota bacterium]|nr:TfuA-like protein [Chloroflexota bacterium]